VSCDALKLVALASAATSVYTPELPVEPCVASPSGASATRPRASIGQKETAGLDGRVDGSVKLGLVVDAVEPQSAGEVDQRFLLVQLAKHLRGSLQGGKLAIGIEDVELAVILAEGRASVCAAGGVDRLRGALAFAYNYSLQNAEQPVAIGGEVLQSIDRTTLIAEDGNKIDSRHLRADELFRGREGTELVGWIHRRHVEVKSQQATILAAFVVLGFRRDLRASELLIEPEVFPIRFWGLARALPVRQDLGARRFGRFAERHLR
jgi:hypothetical protein